MSKLIYIAREEILVHLREWTFYLTAVGMPLVFAAAGLLPQLQALTQASPLASVETVFSEAETPTDLTGYIDRAGLIDLVPPGQMDYLRPFTDEAAAAEALAQGEIVRYYVIAADYPASGDIIAYSANPQFFSSAYADNAIRELIRDNLLRRLDDPNLAQRLQQPVQFDRGGRPAPPAFSFIPPELDQRTLTLAGLVAGLFAYIINVGGDLVVRALKRETRAKLLEVMISSTTPGQFIGGKLAGLTALSLAQAALTLLVGAFVYGRSPESAGPAALPLSIILLSLPYLLLGYLAYCGGIMGVAAVWPNLPESATLLAAARLLALSPLIGALFILPDAGGQAALLLTINPWTAPLLMPFRLLLTPVPLWQWGLGLAGLLAWTAGSIWLSVRLFRLHTLLTGRPTTPRIIWQAVWG